MNENEVAQQIVDSALRVHTALGPGLLESVYQAALAYELEKRGLRVTRQQAIPVIYEAIRIDTGFHADLVVENKVIVEIKSVETVAPVHKKQLLSYLKLAAYSDRWRSAFRGDGDRDSELMSITIPR
jgi:GxxExxY protein